MTDTKLLNQVYSWLEEHQDDIIHDLMDISAIESVSDASLDVKPFGQSCLNVLKAMLEKGEKAGFETQDYDHYVGGILYDAHQKEEIGIWGHLDVVPAGEGWMSDPYTPTLRDGLLFGRGVGDNKSGCIAGFYILQAFRALNIPLRHNIHLFLGTNEEKGMADVEYYVSKYPVPKFSFVPDGGFPGGGGEFGRLRYILHSNQALSDDFVDAYAGTVFNIIPNKATVVLKKDTQIQYQALPETFDIEETPQGIQITAHGVSCHAAGPERGVNAIRVLTDALISLKGLKKEDQAILEFINNVNQDAYGTFLGFAKTDDISGQTVSSGTVLQYHDGHLSLTNDCRYCVSDQGDRIRSIIEEKCQQYHYSLEIAENSKPYYLDKEGPIVKTVEKVYQDYTGQEAHIVIGKGGTYAGKIPNAMATGSVYRGDLVAPDYILPGHGGAHQPDEFIPVKAILKASRS